MKIMYTNFRKEFPASGAGKCFNSWFYFKRFWSGKLITIGMKHHQITIDFRGDFFDEITGKKVP